MLDYTLLAALSAVIRTGSFERAARRLNVTPSAVSQRIKLLEERFGAALVVRGQPCTATAAGQRLCQHVEQVMLLEQALPSPAAPRGEPGQPRTLRVAVNADSLATWFVAAMAAVPDVLFDLVVDDQDHSAEWLRRGDVLAAVTAHAQPVQGCDAVSLGALRYFATASPGFLRRWFGRGKDGGSASHEAFSQEAFSRAPCLTFDRKDRLQQAWLRQLLGEDVAAPVHWLPSSHGFVEAALAGIGWGMNPHALVAGHLQAGRLVVLADGPPLDVPLVWQVSRVVAPALASVTAAVRRAAREVLVQTG